MTAFLLLGSNIGDREENIKNALSLIGKIEETSIIRTSKIYETEPWGYKNQPFFLNSATKIETDLSPQNLLLELKNIEKIMGRKKTKRYGPRIIDIDILFYGDLIINEKDLIIPHKELTNRRFALICLKEIAGEFIHPIHKKTIKELLLGFNNERQ
ncbi:MAG: 2-amino-4-hydroxy-6-hydroxymethyldihydropteridine diphosphokinase [bacterium]